MRPIGRKKNRKVFWLILTLVMVSSFYCRGFLVKTGLDITLQRIFSDAQISYFSVEWKKEGIVVEDLYIESGDYHLRIPKLVLSCHFHLSDGYIEPRFIFLQPQVILLKKNAEAASFAIPAIIQKDFIATKIDIAQGEVHFAEEVQPIYFSCKSGVGVNNVGTAIFSSENDLNPELWIDLKRENDAFYISTKLRQTAFSRVCHIASFFYPKAGLISSADGDLEFSGEIVLKKDFTVQQLNAEFDVHDLRFDHPFLGVYLGAQSGHLAFSYPSEKEASELPFWKTFLACVSIEKGEFFFTQPFAEKDWGFNGIDFSLESLEEEPVFHLEGTLITQEKEAHCILQGKGVVHEDSSFWLESNFFLEQEETFEGFFAFCATENQRYRLETEFSSLKKEHIKLLSGLLSLELPYYKDGAFAGKVTSFWENKLLTKVLVDDLVAKDLCLQQEKIDAFFPEVLFAGAFTKKESGFTIDSLAVSSQNGRTDFFYDSSRHIDDVLVQLTIEKNELMPSVMQGNFLGNQVTVYVEGDIEKAKASVAISPRPLDILQMVSPELFACFQNGFSSQMFFQVAKDKNALSGQLELILDDQTPNVCVFETTLEKNQLWPVSGKFDIKSLSAPLVTSSLHLFDPTINFLGEIAIKGAFDDKALTFDLEGSSFSLKWKDSLGVFENVFGKKKWKAAFDVAGHSWQFDLPIAKASFKHNEFFLANVEADLKVNWGGEPSLNLFVYQGDFCGLSGVVASHMQTHVQYEKKAWFLEDLLATLQMGTKSFTLDIPSCVFAEDQLDVLAKVLSPEEEILQIKGRATFQKDKIGVDLKEESHFFGAALAVKELSWKKGQLDVLEMHPIVSSSQVSKALEILIEGGFVKASHASLEKNIPKGDLQTHLIYRSNVFSFQIEGQNVVIGNDLKKVFSLSGKKIGNRYDVDRVVIDDLIMQTSFVLDDQRMQFLNVLLRNDDLALKAKGYLDLDLQNFDFDLLASSWKDPKGRLQLGAKGAIKGSLKTEQLRAVCALEGSYDNIHISSKGDVPFIFSFNEGIILPEAMFTFEHAEKPIGICKIERCTGLAHDKGLLIQQIEFSLSPHAKQAFSENKWLENLTWKGYLEGEGMVEVLAKGVRFEGSLVDGDLKIKEVPLTFRGITFSYNQGNLQVDLRALYDKILFDIEMKGNLAQHTNMTWDIKRGSEVLKAAISQEKGEYVVQAITGKILGLECNVKQVGPLEDKHFFGEVAFDIDSMQPLLSKELFKQLKKIGLTHGYKLQGNFFLRGDNSSFVGKLAASEFDLLGCIIDTLQADMKMTSQKLEMHNIRIDDPALELLVKEMVIAKEQGEWTAKAPLVKIQNFKPSLLTKKYEKQVPKPFMVRSAILTDLNGSLDNLDSFTAKGKAHFTNLLRQESHFLVPSELLKNLGLDPQVFVPVTGECAYVLESGKIFLQDLQDTYSEGKRSEFYLASNGEKSYIDLSGNISIDIRMKQNVIVKLTEPFLLRVRGTLKQPKYSLHKVK